MTNFTHHIVLPPRAQKGDEYQWFDLVTGQTRTAVLNRKFIREDELEPFKNGAPHKVVNTWIELTDTSTGEIYERILMEDVNE